MKLKYFSLVMCFLLAGCAETDIERNIVNEPHIISASGQEWTLQPAFVNKGNSTYLLLGIEGSWQVESPWQEVIINDRKIKIWAQLEDKNGKIYFSEIIGRANDKINLRFSNQLPRNTAFTKLRIFPSEDFPVKSISLHSRNFK